MEDLEIRRVRRGLRAANHVGGPCQQVLLPFRDLGGMHAKLCRQLRQCLLVLDRGNGHLCLECRPVIPSRSLHRLAFLVRSFSGASVKQGYHLSYCPNFWGPLSLSQWSPHVPTDLDKMYPGTFISYTCLKLCRSIVREATSGILSGKCFLAKLTSL